MDTYGKQPTPPKSIALHKATVTHKGPTQCFYTSNCHPTESEGHLLMHHVHTLPRESHPHQVRWTVGGDQITYNGDVSTKTANLIMAKLLFNSVVSTPNA